MNLKSLVLSVYSSVNSLFKRLRIVQDVFCKKSKIDAKMDVERLATDHWGYVEAVLLRHGVGASDVQLIGMAYRNGFVRGWSLARYCFFFGVDRETASEVEWWRWVSNQDYCPEGCKDHYREAFAHGWKHRIEVIS